MAKVGAPKGNKNAVSGKEFHDTLRYVLASYEDDEVKRGQALKAIMKSLVKEAIKGSQWAVAEVANRLDGKPGQVIEATVTHDVPVPTYEDLRADIVKEHGEAVARLLLHEISKDEYKAIVDGNGTLN